LKSLLLRFKPILTVIVESGPFNQIILFITGKAAVKKHVSFALIPGLRIRIELITESCSPVA